MSIESSQASVTYLGTGSGTIFPIPMRVDSKADLVVEEENPSGDIRQLEEGLDYSVETVAGVYTEPEPREIILTRPLMDGVYLTIRRVVPLTQELTLGNQGALFPKTMERSLDKLTMMAQQLHADITRTNQRVSLTENDLDNMDAATSGLDARIATAEGDVAQLRQDGAAIRTGLTALVGTVEAVSRNVQAVDDTVQTVRTRVDGLSTNIGGVTRTVDGLSGSVGNIAGSVAALSENLGAVTRTTENTGRNLDAVSRTVTGLTGDIDGLSRNLDGMTKTVDTVIQDVGSLSGTVDGLTGRVRDLESREPSESGEGSVLTERVDGVETRLDDLGNRTGILETKSSSLAIRTGTLELKATSLAERLGAIEANGGGSGGGGSDDPSGNSGAAVQALGLRVDVVEDETVSIRAALEELENQSQTGLAALATAKADRSDVSAVAIRIDSVATDVETISTRLAGKAEASAVTSLGTRMERVETKAESTASRLEDLKTTTDDQTARLDGTEDAVAALRTEVDGKAAASAVTSLASRVESVETTAGSLATSLAGKAEAGDVSTLSGTVGGLASRVGTVESGLAGKADSDRVATLQSRVEALEASGGSGGGSGNGGGGGRAVATGPVTFFLDTKGNDANNGIAGNAAILTLGRLAELMQGYDFAGQPVSITFSTGTWNEPLLLVPGNTFGAETLTITGNKRTPSTIAGGVVVRNVGATTVTFSNIQCNGTMEIHGSSVELLDKSIFAIPSGKCLDIRKSSLNCIGEITIKGGTNAVFLHATTGSTVTISSPTSFSTSPSFTHYYIAESQSYIDVSEASFSGQCTVGTQFTVGPGSTIWTNNRRASFPANTSNVSQNGGAVLY